MRCNPTSGHTLLILLAALLLRAGIPAGYMPASWGSGLLVEMCPAGMPAGVMQALTGEKSHHHHDHADQSAEHFDAEQCPIGHLLTPAVTVDSLVELHVDPPRATFESAARLVAPELRLTARSARDPPA